MISSISESPAQHRDALEKNCSSVATIPSPFSKCLPNRGQAYISGFVRKMFGEGV